MTSINSPLRQSIDKRSALTKEELIREYVEPSLPVVLTDYTREWKAIGKLTPAYFRDHYPAVSKEIGGVRYSMTEFVDLMLKATPENRAPYPFNFNVEEYFPELIEDFKPEIIYGKSDRINNSLLPRFMLHGTEVYEIFLGGRGSFFPFLHIDALFLHTQITQIYGSKDFFLYPPSQTSYLYPSKENPKFSQVDAFNPDLEKHPLFAKSTPLKVTVNEGETILFPAGWWHTTQINEPCISLGRVQLNAQNWDAFIKDKYRAWSGKLSLLASPVLAYGKITGAIMNRHENR